MRSIRITILAMLVLLLISGGSSLRAQWLRCSNVSESLVDIVEIVSVAGKPGDTILIPIRVVSVPEVSGFKMLIRYNDTLMTPVPDPLDVLGEGFLVFEMAGRLLDVQDSIDIQFASGPLAPPQAFRTQISQNPIDSGAILATYFYIPSDSAKPYVNMQPGSGIIFRMPFVLSASLVHGDTIWTRFHAVNECFLVGGNIQCADCRRTDFAAESQFGTVTLFPTTIGANMVADSAPAPVIVSFTSDTSTITGTSGQTILRWEVENANSILITGQNLSLSSNNLQDITLVNPGLVGTFTYTLTAYNDSDSSKASLNIVVVDDGGGGGGGSNISPVVNQISPNTYNVLPGDAINFSVTATDAEGGTIILSAASLPPGASFGTSGQVVGTSPVTGSFSWIPGTAQSASSFSVVFSAVDDSGATSNQVSVTINVGGVVGDFLFSTSAKGFSPVGGLKGKKGIFFPIDLVTTQTVYGVQFDMLYDNKLFKLDSVITTDRTAAFDVFDNIGVTPGEVRIVSLGTANETIQPGATSTAILYAVFSIDSLAVPGTDYPVFLENGRESNTADPAGPSVALVTDSGIIQIDWPGDVNLDKIVDVGDLVNIVAYIIGNFGLPERQFETADVTVNDTVNVVDLVGVLNLIFGLPVSPTPGQTFTPEFATVSLDYQDMPQGSSDLMLVTSEIPEDIAGVELVISYDPSVVSFGTPAKKASADRLVMRYHDDDNGRLTVVMYHTNPYRTEDVIAAGIADLVDIPMTARSDIKYGNKAQIRLSRAYMSTAAADEVRVEGVEPLLPKSFLLYQNYPNPFNPRTTIEFFIGNTDGASTQPVKLDIFNILGQTVVTLIYKDLSVGAHSVVWDGTSAGKKVASGIYLYRLRVGEETQTRKMLLLK